LGNFGKGGLGGCGWCVYNSHRENVWLLFLLGRCLRLSTGGSNGVNGVCVPRAFRPTSVKLIRGRGSPGFPYLQRYGGNADMQGRAQGVGAGSADPYLGVGCWWVPRGGGCVWGET